MGCDQFTPHTTIHVPSLKRVLQPSPSPPTPSDPDAVPSLTLDALPSDILFHIATFLEPPLEPYTQGGFHTLSPSDSWCDPGVDLLRFASTCRVVYRAVSSRLGVHFGLTVSSTWTQHPSWEVTYGQTAPVPVIARPENDADAARRVLSTLLAPLPLLSTLTVPFPGTRIRHLFLHTVVGAEHGSFLAPHLIKHMPRLETFAYVHATANDVVLGDSWSLGAIGWATLAALAKCCPALREIYLSGAAARRTAPRPEIVGQEGISFGDQLERITLAVSGDGLCRLLASAPALKRVVVWREFTMAPTSGTEDWWWTDSSWKTVEALELRGFSGNTGRPLLLAAVKRLNVRPAPAFRAFLPDHVVNQQTLRSLNPTLDIPLRSLTLSEPHQFETLSADILPAFANLPHLTSLSFLVWRSRAFNPAFITGLAEKFPHLTELSIGLETEALHYWAGSLVRPSVSPLPVNADVLSSRWYRTASPKPSRTSTTSPR